jgi:hypothetical protein
MFYKPKQGRYKGHRKDQGAFNGCVHLNDDAGHNEEREQQRQYQRGHNDPRHVCAKIGMRAHGFLLAAILLAAAAGPQVQR